MGMAVILAALPVYRCLILQPKIVKKLRLHDTKVPWILLSYELVMTEKFCILLVQNL